MNSPDTISESRKREARRCIQDGRLQQARDLFVEVCRTAAQDYEAWFLLGAVNGQMGRISEAAECCRRVIRLRPDFAEAHYNLGQACKRLDKTQQAEACFREAVRLKPDYAEAWDNLGYLLQERGNQDEAVQCYRMALRLRPDFVGTRYLLAAQGDLPAPEKAPPEYVRGLFDNYADRFEDHLVNKLECRIPQQLESAVARVLGPGSGDLGVLDIGCGTGLCGPWLCRYARRLVGVDLSPGMIAQCRKKGVYDELRVEDAVDAMRASGVVYDLIVAADVFVYLGDLAPLFQACAAVLNAGGLLAFSIESEDQGKDFRLRLTNRYAHSTGYITGLADHTGMQVISRDAVILRKHLGAPVAGEIFVLRMTPTGGEA